MANAPCDCRPRPFIVVTDTPTSPTKSECARKRRDQRFDFFGRPFGTSGVVGIFGAQRHRPIDISTSLFESISIELGLSQNEIDHRVAVIAIQSPVCMNVRLAACLLEPVPEPTTPLVEPTQRHTRMRPCVLRIQADRLLEQLACRLVRFSVPSRRRLRP